MAVSEQQLSEVLSRASRLMSPEGQRQIDFARNQNRHNFNADEQFVPPVNSRNLAENKQVSNIPMRNTKSKLPKVIQESLTQNPIIDEVNEFNTESSVLNNIQLNQQSMLTEQYHTPVQQSYNMQYTPQSIDYNYIRAIVNECIQNNIQQIKEEILKESTLKTIRVGAENKIQLIDNKNNLYESKLEFKKNISKK